MKVYIIMQDSYGYNSKVNSYCKPICSFIYRVFSTKIDAIKFIESEVPNAVFTSSNVLGDRWTEIITRDDSIKVDPRSAVAVMYTINEREVY